MCEELVRRTDESEERAPEAAPAVAPAKKPTRFGANLPGRRKEPLEEKKKAFSLFGK